MLTNFFEQNPRFCYTPGLECGAWDELQLGEHSVALDGTRFDAKDGSVEHDLWHTHVQIVRQHELERLSA